eukprot:4718071-Amphidinium_carterae.1
MVKNRGDVLSVQGVMKLVQIRIQNGKGPLPLSELEEEFKVCLSQKPNKLHSPYFFVCCGRAASRAVPPQRPGEPWFQLPSAALKQNQSGGVSFRSCQRIVIAVAQTLGLIGKRGISFSRDAPWGCIHIHQACNACKQTHAPHYGTVRSDTARTSDSGKSCRKCPVGKMSY